MKGIHDIYSRHCRGEKHSQLLVFFENFNPILHFGSHGLMAKQPAYHFLRYSSLGQLLRLLRMILQPSFIFVRPSLVLSHKPRRFQDLYPVELALKKVLRTFLRPKNAHLRFGHNQPPDIHVPAGSSARFSAGIPTARSTFNTSGPVGIISNPRRLWIWPHCPLVRIGHCALDRA